MESLMKKHTGLFGNNFSHSIYIFCFAQHCQFPIATQAPTCLQDKKCTWWGLLMAVQTYISLFKIKYLCYELRHFDGPIVSLM